MKEHSNHRNTILLCIGAQKAGTTWLEYNFRSHPQITVTPVKELHFFDRIGRSRSYFNRLTSDLNRDRKWRNKIVESAKNLIYLKNPSQSFNTLRLLLMKPRNSNINQYFSIMHGFANPVAADITPAYAILNREIVEKIQKSGRDIKVLFVMRDLIDRHWSATRMLKFRKDNPLRILTIEEVAEMPKLDNPRNNYMHTINAWTSVFSPSQIHFCFFDDLIRDPLEFYNQILDFLQIDRVESLAVEGKVFETRKVAIPDDVERFLCRAYREQTNLLSEYFNKDAKNYPAKWLARIDEILRRTKVQPTDGVIES